MAALISVKGMLRQNIEHFLKKRKYKYEKLGFFEMN